MGKKYKLSQQVKEDLQVIYEYGLFRWGEAQADLYFSAFFASFIKISEQPEAYQKVDHIKKGYRRCVCGVDSIFFREVNGQIEIMAIIGNQDLTDL